MKSGWLLHATCSSVKQASQNKNPQRTCQGRWLLFCCSFLVNLGNDRGHRLLCFGRIPVDQIPEFLFDADACPVPFDGKRTLDHRKAQKSPALKRSGDTQHYRE